MKKSLFADEIATGMFNELEPEIKKQASVNLVKAVDYLNAAFEIFEESGFITQADQILNILYKVSADSLRNVSIDKDSPFKALLDSGITHKDIMSFSKGNQFAIAKINQKLREIGYDDDQIRSLLDKFYMSAEEAEQLLSPNRSFTKIDDFITNPFSVSPGKKDLKPGDEFVISTLASYHKRSSKINDPHTKGLTPDKMVKNLLHHGTEFNMTDDGTSVDLLNLEVNDDQIEVSDAENTIEMDFEDEI